MPTSGTRLKVCVMLGIRARARALGFAMLACWPVECANSPTSSRPLLLHNLHSHVDGAVLADTWTRCPDERGAGTRSSGKRPATMSTALRVGA